MKIKHLDTLDGIISINKQLSWIFNLFYNKDEVIGLNKLSIGALLDCGKSTLPSEQIDIIKKDLKLHILESDACILYQSWTKKIIEISKLFEQLERSVIIPTDYAGQWQQASSKVQIPVEVSLIDQIARRMNITWDEASKLSWSEVYLMQKIDKRQAYFDYLVSQQVKSKTK